MDMLRSKWKHGSVKEEEIEVEVPPADEMHEIIIFEVGDSEQDSDDKTCRICLKEGKLPIFVGSATENLCEAICEFGGIEVSADDPYPKFVCQPCHALLQGAISFRKTAQLSHDILKKQEAKEKPEQTLEIYDHSYDSKLTDHSYHSDNSDPDYTPKETIISGNINQSDDLVTDDLVTDDPSTNTNSNQTAKRGKRQRRCLRCDLTFSSLKEYRVHTTSTEHENKRIECKICKKSFSHNYYRKHPCVRNPLYKPPITHICDVCGKEFTSKSLHNRHRIIHFDERPYECTYCPYRGRFAEALKMHIRSHTGEKPYQCTLCPSRFINSGVLNLHMLTHKGTRDFHCETCGKGFYLKRDLELHIKVDHLGIKEFVCSTCGKAFGYRYRLTKHQRRVHMKTKEAAKKK